MERHSKRMEEKARKCKVRSLGDGLYLVASPSGGEYVVDPVTPRCTCDWHKHHPETACSHAIAARREHEEAVIGRRVSVWNDEADARRQHRPRFRLGDVWATSRATA